MKQRIWEIDALRGIMIIGVLFVHLFFDLDYYLGIDVIKNPALQYCADHCGILFVILSGLSVTLGKRSVRRGLQVLGFGMVITAVTLGMYLLKMGDRFVVIPFGVLHLLGTCMLLWPLFKKLPTWALGLLGAGALALGWWFDTLTVSASWLFPLGLRQASFTSGDYFPIFPHLGWFLLGAVLGKLLYKEKQSRLRLKCADGRIMGFLRWCGTHSIWIYLIHQPVFYGIIMLL